MAKGDVIALGVAVLCGFIAFGGNLPKGIPIGPPADTVDREAYFHRTFTRLAELIESDERADGPALARYIEVSTPINDARITPDERDKILAILEPATSEDSTNIDAAAALRQVAELFNGTQ